MAAALAGHLEIVIHLLEQGANINQQVWASDMATPVLIHSFLITLLNSQCAVFLWRHCSPFGNAEWTVQCC